MVWKVVSVALMAAAGMAGVAGAQGRGPAEQPPAGFAGQQYVDSRGCVFLRAGHGGQVNWVQRVNLDRKPLCGYPPTAQLMAQANRELAQTGTAQAPAAAPSRAPSAAPGPTVAASGTTPMATVATTTAAPRISAPAPRAVIPPSQYAAPRVAGVQGALAPVASAAPAAAPAVRLAAPAPTPSPAPEPTVFVTENDRAHAAPAAVAAAPMTLAPMTVAPVAVAPATAPAPRQLGAALGMAAIAAACPPDAPYGQTYDLVGGGQVMVCTAAGQRLTGLRPGDTPIPAYGGGRYAHADHRVAGGMAYHGAHTGAETFAVPKGYRAAWSDDRLNPNRAVGTATGAASMRQVWSDDVPQQDLRDAARQGKTVKRVSVSSKAIVSSKAAVTPRAVAGVAGARFVQVGSYGVPENAARAAQRLQSMGLPVQISRASIKGKPVQVVRAGPFASPEAAQSALSAARQAGFSDALLRR